MIDEHADTPSEIAAAVAQVLAARPTFKVGDRVRVRLNGECARVRANEGRAGVLDGKVGIVDDIKEPEFRGGHYVGVRLARPVLGYHKAGIWAAPSELELLPPDASQLEFLP